MINEIEKGDETFIIDTKWKNINGSKPSTNDLRQMYVYNDYWKSSKAMLLYPSNNTTFTKEDFIPFNKITETVHHKCGLGKISILAADNKTLDKELGNNILEWFNLI
jgi:5-methylcytosine-specific restriction enzyme subunit McrC